MSSRNRQSAARPTPHRQSNATPGSSLNRSFDGDLPPYKKPSHPLNERAQAKLRDIYSNRTAGSLRDHQTSAAKFITETAGSINDVAREQEEYVAKRRKKWERGERNEEQEETEQQLADLKENVEKQTARLEESMRSIIDSVASAQRISDTLTWVKDNGPRQIQAEYDTQMSQRNSQSQRRGRNAHDEDEDMEDDEEPTPGPTPGPTPLTQGRPALTGPSVLYKERMETTKMEYLSLSHATRYTKDNDYIGFKRMVHDATYGEEGPALPHPDTWFTESGAPAPGMTATQTGSEDDDDIVIDKATISTRCPITFQQFKEPFTSRKCPHTFEKNAILSMIRRSNTKIAGGARAIQCPVPGCDQLISAPDLCEDLILIRKIKRMQAAEAQGAEDSDVDDDEDDEKIKDDDMVPATQQPPRSSAIVDLGDPSEEEDDDE